MRKKNFKKKESLMTAAGLTAMLIFSLDAPASA